MQSHRRAAYATLRPAFTLVEALISLAICATLLTALAAAFHASAATVGANDAYFRCTQTARSTLSMFTTEIRRADAVALDPAGDAIRIIRPLDQRGAGEVYRQFCYDAERRSVTEQIFFADGSRGELYDLADNITACKFKQADARKELPADAATACIAISITCANGSASVTLAGSATPRRAAFSAPPAR